MILFALFVLGAHVGSFLNVCIWRLPRGESVMQPPSHCPKCDTRLRAWDLVPILSQLFLRARCRYCGSKISWRYAGIETLTGILFVLIGAQPGNLNGGLFSGIWSGDTVRLLQQMVVVACLVVIFWIDYETFLIPISAAFLIGLAGIGADIWHVVHDGAAMTDGAIFGFSLLPAPLPESLVAMVATAGFLWIVREIFSQIYQREAMGFGDIFLTAGIAANIGWSGNIGTFFFLSVLLGALVGVALQLPRAIRAYRWAKKREAKRRADKRKPAAWRAGALARHALRRPMPFGPYLAVGAIVALLYGTRLNAAYLDLVNPPPNSGVLLAPTNGLPNSFPMAPPPR